eukprot:g32241.t1
MRGAVMIAYPAFHRLPVYDPARQELEEREELDGIELTMLMLFMTCGILAYHEIRDRTDQSLEQYVGKNEKTKIVAKLAPKNAGAPVREPRIDENTHKAMMAHYYRKQEEQKKLQEIAQLFLIWMSSGTPSEFCHRVFQLELNVRLSPDTCRLQN